MKWRKLQTYDHLWSFFDIITFMLHSAQLQYNTIHISTWQFKFTFLYFFIRNSFVLSLCKHIAYRKQKSSLTRHMNAHPYLNGDNKFLLNFGRQWTRNIKIQVTNIVNTEWRTNVWVEHKKLENQMVYDIVERKT